MLDKTVSKAGVYTDLQGLADLRREAEAKSPEAIDKVARQFEGVFVQMVVKSMRDTLPEGGLFDSDAMEFYQEMYDKQLSLHLSEGRGIGLREVIARQLGANTEPESEAEETNNTKDLQSYQDSKLSLTRFAIAESDNSGREHREHQSEDAKTDFKKPFEKPIKSKEDFINVLGNAASKAAEEIGVDGRLLLAQAALETGWGQHMIATTQGSNSHNLFGIKANNAWNGSIASVGTVEFIDGVAIRERANFRAYSSYEESFADYVAFLKNNPRYQNALTVAADSAEYIRALQDAGYATDPQYAEKVLSIYQMPEIMRRMQDDATAQTAKSADNAERS